MTPTRVVKGHRFTLRFAGMGLGSHVAVKIVRTKDTCRDGSPVAGGQEMGDIMEHPEFVEVSERAAAAGVDVWGMFVRLSEES